MLRLTSKVIIGDNYFNGVTSVEIDSSWDSLTDRCTITFPRKVSWKGRGLATGTNPILKREQPLVVSLGYNDKNTEVFWGFVREVSAEIPVRVECEDAMYLLKKREITKSYRSVSLETLIADIIGNEVEYKVMISTDLGQFRISKATPAKVLEYLREHYFIRSFFRGGILYVGLAIVPELQRERKIRFDRNVISHNLEYRQKEDIRLLLKAVIIQPGNKREEVEVGEKDGEQRTFHYYNISASAAKKRLEQEAERLMYTGYRGSFTTFGSPDFRHGDIVDIVDPVFPDREGRYLAKAVKTTFGEGGYRQEITLESKV